MQSEFRCVGYRELVVMVFLCFPVCRFWCNGFQQLFMQFVSNESVILPTQCFKQGETQSETHLWLDIRVIIVISCIFNPRMTTKHQFSSWVLIAHKLRESDLSYKLSNSFKPKLQMLKKAVSTYFSNSCFMVRVIYSLSYTENWFFGV